MKKLYVLLLLAGVVAVVRYRGCNRHDDPARNHAWDASKPLLSADLDWIIHANVVELRDSALVRQAIAQFPNNDVKSGLAAIKVTCNFDALSVIDSVVVASDEHQYKAIVVAFDKLDRKGFETCLTKLAKLRGRSGRISERDGITTYADFFDETVLAKWIGTDVIAVALGSNGLDEEDVLRGLTKGGLAGDTAMLKLVTSPRTSWYAQRNSGMGDGPTPGYTTVAVRGSNVNVDMRLFVDPAAVEAEAAWLQTMIDAGKDREDLKPLLDAIEVHAERDHVRATATFKGDDLLRLLKGLD